MKRNTTLSFRNYLRYAKLLLLTGDLVFLNVSYIFAYIIEYGNLHAFNTRDVQLILFLSNIFWMFIALYYREFNFSSFKNAEHFLFKTLRLIFCLMATILTFCLMFCPHIVLQAEFLLFFGTFIVIMMVYRIITIFLLRQIRKSGISFRNVVIIGSGQTGSRVYDELSNDLSHGYQVLGYFDDNPEHAILKTNFLGTVRDVDEYVISHNVHEIYFTLKDFQASAVNRLVSFCENNLIRLKFIPDYFLFHDKEDSSLSVDFCGNIPVVPLRREPLEQPLNRLLKRGFDIVFSTFVILTIFTWLFPILILLVKLSSEGPVFFRQRRSGEGNNKFWCWKFRTMRVNSHCDVLQATKDDSRITRVGKFLRKSSLDELPQFFNVLTGNMSVVGPRPHMIKHTDEYKDIIDKYLVRHYARPGITGWAQVNGYRGETRTLEKMAKRIEYDIWYIEHWSSLLELKIIYLTLKMMVLGDKKCCLT